MIGSIAASVFPVPVGLISSTFFPSNILGMASSWIFVGFNSFFFSIQCLKLL